VDAQEALRLGLVNRVVPHDELASMTAALAARLAAGPTKAYGLTKRALTYGLHAPLEAALEYEAHLQEIAGRSADHREGVAAFFEKRTPTYQGQ
jgi:2-(1,2-epoxy-1,2-dihydrophenyl)acetyl-CoA isomerase